MLSNRSLLHRNWFRSNSSSSATTGCSWTGLIYFDPQSDSETGTDYNLKESQLKTRLAQLIDATENIKKIWIYYTPLFSWQWTASILYHAFIVLETNDWWWSIEKNSEGLTIQRSKKLEYVRDCYRRRKRLQSVTCYDGDEGRMSLHVLIDWLVANNELSQNYHWIDDNCMHFATRVFDYFAATKTTILLWAITAWQPLIQSTEYLNKANHTVK